MQVSPTVHLNFVLISGGYLPNKKLSVRVLTGMWCLMAVVLINSYTGNLTSYLSIPKLNPIPNSFEELAASSDYKISLQANTVLTKSIMVKRCVTNQISISNEPLNLGCNSWSVQSIRRFPSQEPKLRS